MAKRQAHGCGTLRLSAKLIGGSLPIKIRRVFKKQFYFIGKTAAHRSLRARQGRDSLSGIALKRPQQGRNKKKQAQATDAEPRSTAADT